MREGDASGNGTSVDFLRGGVFYSARVAIRQKASSGLPVTAESVFLCLRKNNK